MIITILGGDETGLSELLESAISWNKHICARFPYDVLVFHELLSAGGQELVARALPACKSVAFHRLEFTPPAEFQHNFKGYHKMNQLLGCEIFFVDSPLFKYKYDGLEGQKNTRRKETKTIQRKRRRKRRRMMRRTMTTRRRREKDEEEEEVEKRKKEDEEDE